MKKLVKVSMERIPSISAIYYALLCEGYDFFAPEKPREVAERLRAFAGEGERFPFFAAARRDTCAVYPYWPRAALLETASFFLTEDGAGYADFPALQAKIMSAGNIADQERGEALWAWLADFPAALGDVLRRESFRQYSAWESAWLRQQISLHADELDATRACLEQCVRRYASPVRRVTVVLNPVKCAYSADYHLLGEAFVFSSGRFSMASIVHECLHPAVHAEAAAHREDILRRDIRWPGIDASYALDGGDAGRLNAFEESCVRQLTARVCRGEYPVSLDDFMSAMLYNADRQGERHEH